MRAIGLGCLALGAMAAAFLYLAQAIAPPVVVGAAEAATIGRVPRVHMTTYACEHLQPGTSESTILTRYGKSEDGSGNDPYLIDISYAYDFAFYTLNANRTCYLYYDENKRLGLAAIDLFNHLP